MSNRTLTRDFYSFAILFAAIYIATSLLDGFVGFQTGSRAITFDSFYPWLWTSGFVFLISSITLLYYYSKKGYRTAFTFGLTYAVVVLVQYVFIYNILEHRELQKYHSYLGLTLLVAGILYGASLLFSSASERVWLKRAGTGSIFFGSGMIISFLLFLNTDLYETKLLLEKIHRILSVCSVVIPAMFLLNFRDESRMLAADSRKTPPIVWLELAKVVALLGSLLFGLFFLLESVRMRRGKPFVPSAEVSTQARAFPACNFVNPKGDVLPYRLVLPLDYDSTKRYPMVVCLHHGGAHGTDNMRQLAADPAPFLLNETNRKKYPAFIFIPHCPEGAGFGGSPGYPSVDSLTFDAIRMLKKEYAVDADRIYVMGISGGGFGSWHFVGKHPEMFAAAIPICGFGDPKFGETLVDMPIWAFHGAKDRLAPVIGSRDIIAAIEKAGGKPKYTEYGTAGHDIWRYVKEEPALMDWLFAQKKVNKSMTVLAGQGN